jgi:hypothetical protein
MTAQLGFDLRPRPVQRAAAISATLLLWTAAGRPTNTTDLTGTVDATRSTGARCWWCGHEAPDGHVRPLSCLTDTFPYPLEAAVPASPWLCLPCGWTLCDRVALPQYLGEAKIRARAKKGGRLIVSVNGEPAARWLVHDLADGTVGLWAVTGNAASEEPWHEAWAAGEVPPGMAQAVSYAQLAPEATEKFRSYHHLATLSRWWPCTDSDRAGIREWLCNPPPPPWVAVIGDGKKHAAIRAQLLDAVTTDSSLAVALFKDAIVQYRPAELIEAIASIEALIRAGAGDSDIETGLYSPRGIELVAAIRQHEPVVARWRGGPGLGLAMYLRRNRQELSDAV